MAMGRKLEPSTLRCKTVDSRGVPHRTTAPEKNQGAYRKRTFIITCWLAMTVSFLGWKSEWSGTEFAAAVVAITTLWVGKKAVDAFGGRYA